MRVLRRSSVVVAFLVAACAPAASSVDPQTLTVTIVHDGAAETVTSDGSVVRDVIAEAGLTLAPLDEITPGEFSPLTDGMTITIVRVIEELEIEEVEIPFDEQIVRNEGLPDGETRLLQTGRNGMEEITYRTVYKDGEQFSRSAVRRNELTAPIPEIVMVGAQSTFTVIPIEGTLAYLSAGNAWVMRESSGSRQPLTISSDLDGRVFRISPDGSYLLFTRNAGKEGTFNSLWAIATNESEPDPLDLKVDNVLWADWSPAEPRRVAFSTGEPRERAPGWQANNDLQLVSFDENGQTTGRPRTLLEPSAGGIYGWYGTNFAWGPDGQQLAYAQADAIGLVILDGPNNTQQFP
ncbi:MAG: G5 domain-containing protein, partial [Anaerolineales bacterium]